MAKYKVTGGHDGQCGVDIKGRRYEPGDTVDVTGKSLDWMVEQGYLAPADAKAKRARTDDGRYRGDDPATPEDEAWTDGGDD